MTDQPAAPLLTPEQEDAVIAAITAAGKTTLKRALGEGLPRPWQVLAHAQASPEFGAKLKAASEAAAEELHAEMADIEDKLLANKVRPNAAAAALANKRWRMERLDRRRWGAKVEVENTGELTLNVGIKRFTPDPEGTC